MKDWIIVAVVSVAVIAVVVIVISHHADAGPEKAGVAAPYMVTEAAASDLMEHSVDHAACQGIPRLGHAGERFVAFDCSYSLNGTYCSGGRFKVLGLDQGGFTLQKLQTPKPYCF